MSRAGAALAALGMALAVSSPASAAEPGADLAALRREVADMRREYDAKISALEARLKAAEDAASQASVHGPVQAPPADAAPIEVVIAQDAPAASTESRSVPGNAANPGVSVVLNGNYFAASRDPAVARIAGFALADEAGLPRRGFSLGESEVTLAANVDPFFSANLTASFSGDNQVSIEEAYVQTSALPGGFTAKAGRFFSAVGYLNERHSHNWSFIDMPLPYRALLGNQYGDDGVQVRWLAPAPFFLEFGGELYRGDAFPGANDGKNGAGTQTAFVHAGADINDASSWLAALSNIRTTAHDRLTGTDLFDGADNLAIASLVYKWAPGGNLDQRNLVLSGEYFYDRQDGDFDGVTLKRHPDGWYVQGVYQFAKGWNAGLRYAALNPGATPAALAGTSFDGLGRRPNAFSAILEHDTSEFARLRAQYTHDEADQRPMDEVLMQYTVIFGPHGAHRY
jgi:hypothetical protein